MLRHAKPEWDDTTESRGGGTPARRPGRKREISPGRPFTEDDKWAEETRRACALAIVRWMKGSLDLSRKVKTLKIEEFDNMAEAVTSEFIVRATQRIKDAPADPVSQRLTSLLF